MATQKGTIRGITLVHKDATSPGRETYLAAVDFPAYTGASDSGQIDAPAAVISDKIRDGKTRALISSALPTCVGRGTDTNNQSIFVGATTIATADITFNLTAADGTTEISSSTASTGVQMLFTVSAS